MIVESISWGAVYKRIGEPMALKSCYKQDSRPIHIGSDLKSTYAIRTSSLRLCRFDIGSNRSPAYETRPETGNDSDYANDSN